MPETEVLPAIRADVNELHAILMDELEPPEISTDPEAIQREIMEQIWNASSDEELLLVGQATPWQDLLGVPVEVTHFTWRKSQYDQGAKVFFVVQATRLDDGEKLVLTTSGKNVIMALANIARRDAFPFRGMLQKAEKPTANGYHPLWLVPLPKKAAK